MNCLSNHRADISITDNKGMTPLHYACQNSSPTIMRLVDENPSQLSIKCNMGKLPREYLNQEEFQDFLIYTEKQQKIIPKFLTTFNRIELATSFWLTTLFLMFLYLPIYLSFLFGFILVYIAYKIRSSMEVLNKMFVSIWNTGNFLAAITIIVKVIPNSNSLLFICSYLISHSLCLYCYYLGRKVSPGRIEGNELDIMVRFVYIH